MNGTNGRLMPLLLIFGALCVGCTTNQQYPNSSNAYGFSSINETLYVYTSAFGGLWGGTGEAWVGNLDQRSEIALVHHRPTKSECYFTLGEFDGLPKADSGSGLRDQFVEHMRSHFEGSTGLVSLFSVKAPLSATNINTQNTVSLDYVKTDFVGKVKAADAKGRKVPRRCILYVAELKRPLKPSLFLTGTVFMPNTISHVDAQAITEATEKYLSGMRFTLNDY